MSRFIRRVWRTDVAPLLRGDRRASRIRAARSAGAAGAVAGLLADGLLGFRGRPFTRALTVLGSSIGAMIPDIWDWNWFEHATPRQRGTVRRSLESSAAEIPVQEALAFYGLDAASTFNDLKTAWRRACRRWHPDLAPHDRRAEFQLRFLAYRRVYERLAELHRDGRLPAARPARRADLK